MKITPFLIINGLILVVLIIYNNNPVPSSFTNFINILPYHTAQAFDPNNPPMAKAGINQTVNENTTVTLNGIAMIQMKMIR